MSILAAICERAGAQVSFYDMNAARSILSKEQVLAEVQDAAREGYDIVACGGLTTTYSCVKKIGKLLRPILPDALFVTGGNLVTTLPNEIMTWLKEYDVGTVGDAWETILDIQKHHQNHDWTKTKGIIWRRNNEIILNDLRAPLRNIDSLPYPAWHLLSMETYFKNSSILLSEEAWTAKKRLDLATSFGCPLRCVAGHEWLFTDEGIKRVDEAVATSIIVTCEHGEIQRIGKSGFMVASTSGHAVTTHGAIRGKKRCVHVTLQNGLTLDATPDHRILVVEDEQLVWREVQNLHQGDFAAVSIGANLWNKKEDGIDTDTAWVLGYLVGDGCLPSQGYRLQFAVTNYEAKKLTRYFQEHYWYTPRLNAHSQTSKIQNLWVHNRRAWLDFNKWVDRGNKLRIPPIILQSKREAVLAFLDGLWAADGTHTNDNRDVLVTSSAELANGVQKLLLNLGFRATTQGPYKTYGYAGKAESKPLVHYYVIKDVGKGTDTIPMKARYYRCRKCPKWHRRTTSPDRLGVWRKTLERADPFHPLLRNDMWYVPIHKIEIAKEYETFDFEVPDAENFVVSGFFAHNCLFCVNESMIGEVRIMKTEYHDRDVSFAWRGHHVYYYHSTDYIINEIKTAERLLWNTQPEGPIDYVAFIDENFLTTHDISPSKRRIHDIHDAWLAAGFQPQCVKDRVGHDPNRCEGKHVTATSHAGRVTPQLLEVMRDFGMSVLDYGIESFAEENMREVQKGSTPWLNMRALRMTQSFGIHGCPNQILGFPTESFKTIRDNMAAWRELGIVVYPFMLTPFSGSAYFTKYRKKIEEQYGGDLELFIMDLGDCTKPTASICDFTVEELTKLREWMVKDEREAVDKYENVWRRRHGLNSLTREEQSQEWREAENRAADPRAKWLIQQPQIVVSRKPEHVKIR